MNITDLHQFLGMVDRLGKFVPRLSSISEPLRKLLSEKNSWYWGTPQEKAFELKELVCSAPTLMKYDPERETKVTADSSSFGQGAILVTIRFRQH